DGVDGVDGADGADGVDGATGPTGPTGADGLDGADGVDGVDGATGPTGPTGADGVDGVDGVDGATGPTGATTLDSYVQTGNTANGILATSTASCLGNDVAVGGGYSTNSVTVNVTQNAPVFVGTGPATGWTTTATLALGTDTLTTYVICHDVE
ncbi:collagen-like protein, partial [Streptomyces sp. NPDC005506]